LFNETFEVLRSYVDDEGQIELVVASAPIVYAMGNVTGLAHGAVRSVAPVQV
jgi:hypothetical protein